MTAPSPLSPDHVAAYLQHKGWRVTDGGRVAWFWTHHDHIDAEVLMPRIESAADYQHRLAILLADIAKYEQRREQRVADDMALVFDDVTDLTIDSDERDGSIPLQVGSNLFLSARRIMVAAAATTLRRQAHFGRSVPARARAHASHVRLGHTRRGSYVVPVISNARPLPSVDAEEVLVVDLPTEESMFDRRVLVSLSNALDVLHEMTVRREWQPSGSDIVSSVGEGVSYELCKAVGDILTSGSLGELDISFTWAPASQPPHVSSNRVGFPHDAASSVEEVAQRLRKIARPREDVIFGVVEDLHDSEDEPDARVGIKTIIDRRPRLVWLHLDKETYRLALRCHERKQRVIARGVLNAQPGRTASMEVSHLAPDEPLIPASVQDS